MGIIITGIGSYVPDKILTNFDLEKMVDTTDEWIRSRTGISERHISGPNEFSSDLMAPAARQALAMAGKDIREIDLIVVATSFPDKIVPLTSDIFAEKIGAPRNLTAIDMNAECASFCWALASCCEMIIIDPQQYQTVLLVSGDTTSKFTDYTDRESCVLFGDAGAAVVLEQNFGREGTGIIGWYRKSDRRFLDCLSAPYGGAMHFGPNGGGPLLKAIVEITPPMLEEFCAKYHIDIAKIAKIVPHQLNQRITDALKKAMVKQGLPTDVVYDKNIAKFGNCSGTSVGLALDACYREGGLSPGDLVILIGWGAGLKIGITALRWTLPQITKGDGYA